VLRLARLNWRRHVKAGKIDLETCPATDLGIDRDVTVALLHDPVDSGESQPRPLADFFRREERLEEMRPDRGVHPGARVGHGDHCIRAGNGNEVCLRDDRIPLHIRSFDGLLPAYRPRIDDAARSDALRISSTSDRFASPGCKSRSKSCVLPRMAVSRLLKSCAMPPASWPTASIFWDCRNCSSRWRCSLTSRWVPQTRT